MQSSEAVAASKGVQKAVSLPCDMFQGGAHDQRRAAVNKYLFGNPETKSPSRSDLVRLQRATMEEIMFAIHHLLDSTATEHEKVPEIYSSVSHLPFLAICKRIYGAGNREDLLRTSAELLVHSQVSVGDFLRATIGAAICEWVFEGCHYSSLNDLDSQKDVYAIFASELAKRGLPLRSVSRWTTANS